MILEIIIGILGLVVVILGYTTFNLLNKNEKAIKRGYNSFVSRVY